jgi:hypothetical protein
MKRTQRFATLFSVLAMIVSACGAPSTAPEESPALQPSATPAEAQGPEPTPTVALLDLEILEWFEHPIPNLADPSITDTQVEVLIRNPNDFHVQVNTGEDELRFLNAAGEVVYTNQHPSLFAWEGEWMTPGQIAAYSACVCFESQGLEKQEWVSIELVAPIEIATNLAYTTDVEVTAEFVLLEEVLHGYSGPGAAITLTNTSDQVLESISKLVFARDASGRYVGMASFGNAVVSFTENIGIQPGDTASGLEVSDINYMGNERLTYEVQAIGIIAVGVPTEEPLGEPESDWQGIPIMPGAIIGGETSVGYEFTTQATIEEIAQFYEGALAELGFSLSTSGKEAGVIFLFFEKGGSQLIVGILPEGDTNHVQLSVHTLI